ncbi:rod shape-determining protein MreC [Glaciecola sp. XM2]|jgi:rod shape-determining protein MreC|uniref:rod shape-determining protein MreC n=1 Tax=Glaciecola sp. XM2 TaxID=1914931 RepID=UPI001BDF49D3|nr:rod shape-determining protein MreC [Glaciecola sp. XM2]MBT1451680.1 rod shape-determining protein MreC [Glaciecola sp. XM2]
MNEVFARGPSLLTRLAFVLSLSVVAMFIDTKVESVSTFRAYLTSLVSPLQYIADMPGAALSWSASRFTSRKHLLEENELLISQMTMMNEQLQRFQVIQQENQNLRSLLDAPVRPQMQKMIAELMAVDNNPYSHQIVINKGAIDNVFPGQSVLDESGIVGQVIEVGTTNSRVLLLSDVTHAIPARINRNNVTLIVNGIGDVNELSLEHVPHSTDMEEGDLLISSGLGNVFVEGYPIGVISSILRDESQPFAQVKVRPAAKLDRLKYLLLLWPVEESSEQTLSMTQDETASGEQDAE